MLPTTTQAKHVAASLTEACTPIGVTPSMLPVSQLDYGSAAVLDEFYSADVVICDITDPRIQSSIFYQLGVRESLGSKEAILVFEDHDDDATQRLRLVTHYTTVPYKVCFVIQQLRSLTHSLPIDRLWTTAALLQI